LDAASEELARLKSLIGDLLELSKIEAGRLELDFDGVAPAVLVSKAVDVFRAQIEEKQIELTADVPDELPVARADANKITWVLTNLIANALRFAKAKIVVSARAAGGWIRFAVTDDGEGIPPDMQSRIFEKFVQVKSEKNVGGTGLGLAICREIVRAHRGTIWVDSTPGEGSTFTFTIPADQSKGEAR